MEREYKIFGCHEDIISADEIGNKGYYLSKIMGKCRVPEFIVLGADIFIQLLRLKENYELQKKITVAFINKLGILKELPIIQEQVMNMYIPENLKKQILQCISQNGVHEPFAVRSSTLKEDGENASSAGIFESYTNVGIEDLWEKIKKCWASMFSLKAVCYESMNQPIERDDCKMGVIIQSYKVGIKSGVIFSLNPVCPENGMLLEMVDGNGEKLMSGDCGATEMSLGFYNESINKCSKKQSEVWIEELMQISDSLRKEFQFETDIEWLITEERVLNILQCRAITSVEKTKKTEWIYELNEIDKINMREAGAQVKFIEKCKRKRLSLYVACKEAGVPNLKWFFIRYSDQTDVMELQNKICKECGNGYFAIRVNDMLTDFQCKGDQLAKMLLDILYITEMDCLTVSLNYIPENQFSVISSLDSVTQTVRIECVPGIMKGLKTGILVPSTYITNEEDEILSENREYYKECYALDFDMDVFYLKKYEQRIPDLSDAVRLISKYTRKLSEHFINGDIEWWICNDKVYASDYSLELNNDNKADENVINGIDTWISFGKVEGNIMLISYEEMQKLDKVSHSKAINADLCEENIHRIEVIDYLLEKARKRKMDFGKLVIGAKRPCLGLCPLIEYADSFVFEEASKLCHLSIILRERKIPAMKIGQDFKKLEDKKFYEI
ncbi:PEP/pyruvate-binding domain-containing protein [Clostridium tepidiprofundi]|nr:PEP/pyruvate-binding domain-containing protein [Clostridium tepidiprofundi]